MQSDPIRTLCHFSSPRRQTQGGSAIVMLFVLVALFGMLAFAFMQGTRSNVSWVTTEKNKASAIAMQDCTNSLTAAVNRLQLRGCGDLISYKRDGSNSNPGAPTDGSCSVYHTGGGGIKACKAGARGDCSGAPVGGVCPDGTIYIGISADSGQRMYAMPIDAAGKFDWQTAFSYCEGFSGGGYNNWYVPYNSEVGAFYTLRSALGMDSRAGNYYWTASVFNATTSYAMLIDDGVTYDLDSNSKFLVRCIRGP